jgi:hypothetical protein
MTLPRQVLTGCHRLLSVRGEANSPVLAASIVARGRARRQPARPLLRAPGQ